MPPPPAPHEERRSVIGALAALSASFLVMATQYVPRLSNNVWSDEEFSGWTAAIARRLAAGERIYQDFTLPIPPGSIALLAWVERITGRGVFLNEVWLCAVCHLLMALAAYAIARPFASRLVSLMVSAGTLALVVQLPKELAYDHTAQVLAWVALALAVRAFLARPSGAPSRWLGAAGLLTGLTFLFKQSTGTGLAAGVLAALAFLALVDRWTVGRWSIARVREGVVYVVALAVGFGLTLAGVRAVGGSVGGYLRTVFVDGPELKGGSRTLLRQAALYTLHDPTVQISFIAVVLGLVLAWRVAASRERLVLVPLADGAPDEGSGALLQKDVLRWSIVVVAVHLLGAAILAAGVNHLPLPLEIVHGASIGLAPLGLVFCAAFVFGSLHGRRSTGASEGAGAFGALVVAATVSASVHNLSFPGVRFFYDNNAIIAVALVGLFTALERSRWPAVRWAVFAVLSASVLGGKMGRYLEAQERVTEGFWAGMRVAPRGAEILKAARRVAALALADETVLVLPEDVTLAAVIGRPRPKLCGAILFVDQYPARCVAPDLAELEAHPPKVVVIHPRWTNEWRWVYRLWSPQPPAGFINDVFLGNLLPRRYKHDSSYETVWFGAPDVLDVYVLDPEKAKRESDEERDKSRDDAGDKGKR